MWHSRHSRLPAGTGKVCQAGYGRPCPDHPSNCTNQKACGRKFECQDVLEPSKGIYMGQLVQVKMGEYRSVVWVDANGIGIHRHDMVILEVERNLEFAKVLSDPDRACTGKVEAAIGKIIRPASDGDLRQVVNNQIKAS